MSAAAPSKRVLYLLPRTAVHVEARGPALQITGRGIAPASVPVSRVRRITCNVLVNWSGGALALCLGEGITVTLGDGARGLGCIAPLVSPRSTLHADVEIFDLALESRSS